MSHHQDFSSWSPDQERQFVVFEERSTSSAANARKLGFIAAIGAFVLTVLLVFAVGEKPKPAESDDENDALGAETARPAAAAPTPAPAPTENATAPAEAAAAPAEAAPAEAAATAPAAPPPPKGATKAPPTALVGH